MKQQMRPQIKAVLRINSKMANMITKANRLKMMKVARMRVMMTQIKKSS